MVDIIHMININIKSSRIRIENLFKSIFSNIPKTSIHFEDHLVVIKHNDPVNADSASIEIIENNYGYKISKINKQPVDSSINDFMSIVDSSLTHTEISELLTELETLQSEFNHETDEINLTPFKEYLKYKLNNEYKINNFEDNIFSAEDIQKTSDGIVENHQNEKEDTTITNKQINKDILGPLSYNGKIMKLIIGTPVTNIGSGLGAFKSSYYSNRIYEVLIYTDLKSSDIPKVLTGLSKKYSQKTNFSSPVEFQTSDMYYSTTDKINILGKIKKTST